MADGDAYQSMRASDALANTLPQRVEFFGIARRLNYAHSPLAGKKPGIIGAPRMADKG